MARDVITLHPEIAEILRELAQKPGSALLRVPRRDVPRSVMESGSVVSARSATLDEAERHLVQVHREELAFVLRQAAYLRLNEGEDSRHLMVDRALSSLRDHIPREKDVRIGSSRALRGDTGHGEENEVVELLERCVASSVSGWASAGQLAAASHRLVPTDAARIYAAMHTHATGAPGAALVILRSVVATSGSISHQYAAWSNASHVYVRLSQLDRALNCAQTAVALSPREYPAQVNRLCIAARLRLVEEVRHAARALTSLLDTNPQDVQALATWNQGANSARSTEARANLHLLKDRFDEWPAILRIAFHAHR